MLVSRYFRLVSCKIVAGLQAMALLPSKSLGANESSSSDLLSKNLYFKNGLNSK